MVFKDRWSLNTGGHKDRFHCTETTAYILQYNQQMVLARILLDQQMKSTKRNGACLNTMEHADNTFKSANAHNGTC